MQVLFFISHAFFNVIRKSLFSGVFNRRHFAGFCNYVVSTREKFFNSDSFDTYLRCFCQTWSSNIMGAEFDPFVPNALFLYPLKTSENLMVEKEGIGNKWFNCHGPLESHVVTKVEHVCEWLLTKYRLFWKLSWFILFFSLFYFCHSRDVRVWKNVEIWEKLCHNFLTVKLIHLVEFRSLRGIRTVQLKDTEL